MSTKATSFSLDGMNAQTQKALLAFLSEKQGAFTVTSAYELSTEEKKAILLQLGITSLKAEDVQNVVDESLLGGFILKYGDYYLDFSLKAKLSEITESL